MSKVSEIESIKDERQRCDSIVGMLWVDLVNMGLADERHAEAFDYRREQIRQGTEI